MVARHYSPDDSHPLGCRRPANYIAISSANCGKCRACRMWSNPDLRPLLRQPSAFVSMTARN
eukprot:2765235-Lingulodinium_polyedra.AAC.1